MSTATVHAPAPHQARPVDPGPPAAPPSRGAAPLYPSRAQNPKQSPSILVLLQRLPRGEHRLHFRSRAQSQATLVLQLHPRRGAPPALPQPRASQRQGRSIRPPAAPLEGWCSPSPTVSRKGKPAREPRTPIHAASPISGATRAAASPRLRRPHHGQLRDLLLRRRGKAIRATYSLATLPQSSVVHPRVGVTLGHKLKNRDHLQCQTSG